MSEVSNRAMSVPRSDIRILLDMAQSHPDAIHLEIGQPFFPTPSHIVEAAHQAAVEGFTGYTQNAGFLSLRTKFARYIAEWTGAPAAAANIVATCGSMQALSSSLSALLEPGDEVLIPDPGYPNYAMMTRMFEGVPLYFALDGLKGFHPDLSVLESLVSDRTKVLIINSPSNPTGAVYTREEIRDLYLFAEKHDLFILSDEAYDRIIFEGFHVSPRRFDTSGRVVACYSFSKTYSMAGWRIGFLVASPEIAAIMTKMQEVFVACAPSISQKAAEAAIDGPQDEVDIMADFYRNNRDVSAELLTAAGVGFVRPQGAFYLLVDIGGAALDSFAFATRLLNEAGVVVAPGRTFGPGGNRYIRLSLAVSRADLENGLKKIIGFLKKI